MLLEKQAKAEELLNKRIAQLEALVTEKAPYAPYSPISDKDSFHDKVKKNSPILDDKVQENVDDCEIVPPPTDMGGVCELAMNTITNIVAFGTVFDDEDINKTIHGAALKEGCIRVSVDGEIQGDAPLPFPVKGEMELVHEAIGSHAAWPEELVIRRQPLKKKKRKMDFGKSLFDKAELNPFVPKCCKLLYKHATTIMKQTSEAITTVLDEKVFGVHKELFILTENVIDLLEM